MKKLLTLFLVLCTLLSLTGCFTAVMLDDPSQNISRTENKYLSEKDIQSDESGETSEKISEDGIYTLAGDVALYIYIYGKLPQNFITKNEARKLGWEGGGLEEYAPGKCIGGDRFGNYEELLPIKEGRSYKECDIDTLGKSSRGAKRIVYSNDGLIYYTEDHYESFVQFYDKNGRVSAE